MPSPSRYFRGRTYLAQYKSALGCVRDRDVCSIWKSKYISSCVWCLVTLRRLFTCIVWCLFFLGSRVDEHFGGRFFPDGQMHVQ